MSKRRSTFTSSAPLRRGQHLLIHGGAAPEAVKVLHVTGADRYTATIRPLRWTDRLRPRITAPLRRTRHAIREWHLTRCEQRWCQRRETIVDQDWNGWCTKHAHGKTIRHEA